MIVKCWTWLVDDQDSIATYWQRSGMWRGGSFPLWWDLWVGEKWMGIWRKWENWGLNEAGSTDKALSDISLRSSVCNRCPLSHSWRRRRWSWSSINLWHAKSLESCEWRHRLQVWLIDSLMIVKEWTDAYSALPDDGAEQADAQSNDAFLIPMLFVNMHDRSLAVLLLLEDDPFWESLRQLVGSYRKR